jgi:GTP-binding protein
MTSDRIVHAEFVAGAASASQLPAPLQPEIAFAGRSNVGKSSLMNALVGRKSLVRTGSTPGTTRQINFFSVRTEDGLELVLVDLPGYGYAKRAKGETVSWGALIEPYLLRRATLRALVLIVDARRGFEDDDRQLLDFVARRTLDVIVVATKTDKLGAARRKPAVAAVGRAAIGFSAVTGEGTDLLWRRIRRAVGL